MASINWNRINKMGIESTGGSTGVKAVGKIEEALNKQREIMEAYTQLEGSSSHARRRKPRHGSHSSPEVLQNALKAAVATKRKA